MINLAILSLTYIYAITQVPLVNHLSLKACYSTKWFVIRDSHFFIFQRVYPIKVSDSVLSAPIINSELSGSLWFVV